MGSRGPLPENGNLLRLVGSRAPDRRDKKAKAKTTRAISASSLRCPTWLAPMAKTYWKRAVNELRAAGTIANVDQEALATMCQMWAQFHLAQKAIKEHGIVYETVNAQGGVMIRQRPEVQIGNDTARLLRQLWSDFGLTPAARQRIEAPEPEKEQDGAEKLLNDARSASAS